MSTDNDSSVTKTDLGQAVKALQDCFDERSRDLQTELLRAFADYNSSAAANARLVPHAMAAQPSLLRGDTFVDG